MRPVPATEEASLKVLELTSRPAPVKSVKVSPFRVKALVRERLSRTALPAVKLPVKVRPPLMVTWLLAREMRSVSEVKPMVVPSSRRLSMVSWVKPEPTPEVIEAVPSVKVPPVTVPEALRVETPEIAPELMLMPLMVPVVLAVMMPVVTIFPEASTWKALAVPEVRVPETSRLPVMSVLSTMVRFPELSLRLPSIMRLPDKTALPAVKLPAIVRPPALERLKTSVPSDCSKTTRSEVWVALPWMRS